jgi:hypothetical protein
MVKWELLEKSLTNSELLGYKIREEFKGLPSSFYEKEKNKPVLDDIVDSFLKLLEKLELQGYQTIKIDLVKRLVELDGKVFNYLEFSEEDKKILENIEFVQGEVPIPIKTLKDYLKRIKDDDAYKELKGKIKEYNRGMCICLYYNHENEKDPFFTEIELRKIIGDNGIECLTLTNHKYYFDNIDSIVKKALGLS